MAARRRTRRTKVRTRLDWVYRGHAYQISEPQVQADVLGTYIPHNSLISLSAGPTLAQSHILVDSADWFVDIGRMGNTIPASALGPVAIGGEARPERRGALIRAVEGIIMIAPSAWALGNEVHVGVRLGVFEQDVTGVFALDSGYSMMLDQTTANQNTNVGHWANMKRSNLREWRLSDCYVSGGGKCMWTMHIRWRGRIRLQPHECLGLYTEAASGSVETRNRYFLRTLLESPVAR